MKKLLLFSALMASSTGLLMADYIPYGSAGSGTTVGSMNPNSYSFTATSSGDITGYFYGFSAAYGESVALVVQNITQNYGLYNQLTPVGTSFDMGSVNAGDVLKFSLEVWKSPGAIGPDGNPTAIPDYILSSDPSLNPDGAQHIYSTAYTGGIAGIPAGTYVAFEDLLADVPPDWDYNDEQFVFTNVSVPDGGATITLLGMAFAGIGLLRRKVYKV